MIRYTKLTKLANDLRLADKTFTKEQERVFNQTVESTKARDTASDKLNRAYFALEEFLQAFLGKTFHLTSFKDMGIEEASNGTYQHFGLLCKELAKSEQEYVDACEEICLDDKRIRTKRGKYNMAQTELYMFMTDKIDLNFNLNDLRG